MLGDLGSVREFQHPWHRTYSWTRQNQLPDCKANDVKRLLKSYLSFLRAVAHDVDAFDQQFWKGVTAWSRMYWELTVCSLSAGRSAWASEKWYSWRSHERRVLISDVDWFHGDLRKATERELTCTNLPARLWFEKVPVKKMRPRQGICGDLEHRLGLRI